MPTEKKTAVAPDALTTAAQAIGATLGKLAVKTGIAKAPEPVKTPARKTATKKKVPNVKKAASKKAVKKPTRGR